MRLSVLFTTHRSSVHRANYMSMFPLGEFMPLGKESRTHLINMKVLRPVSWKDGLLARKNLDQKPVSAHAAIERLLKFRREPHSTG